MLRRALRRLGVWIDSENVRLYQSFIYTGYIAAGVQTLVAHTLPTNLHGILGTPFAVGWTLILVTCPCFAFAGWAWPHKLVGLWIQLAADIGVGGAELLLAVSLWHNGGAIRAPWAVWIVTMLCLCSVGVAVRSIRKIRADTPVIKAMGAADG